MLDLTMDHGSLDKSLQLAQDMLMEKKKKKKTSKKQSSSGTKTNNKTRKVKRSSIHKKMTADEAALSSDDTASLSGVSSISECSGHSGISLGSTGSGVSVTAISVCSTDSSPADPVLFRHSMLVDGTWKKIKVLPDFEEKLGEQIVLRLMELDPIHARKDMGIASLRGARFEEISRTLVVMVDLIVSLIGPDVEEFAEELQFMGKDCRERGIKIALLSDAIGEAVKCTLQEAEEGEDKSSAWTDAESEAWKLVMENVTCKMEPPEPASSAA